MVNKLKAPYLLPSESSFEFGDWFETSGEEPEVLSNLQEGWVAGTDIRISRKLVFDIPQIRSECRLSESARLRLVISWFSEASKISERIAAEDIVGDSAVEVQIDRLLEGNKIAGKLHIRTKLIVSEPSREPAPGEASRAGSTLCEDEWTIHLDGDGSMLPFAVVDFESLGYPGNASWYLSTSEDPEVDFSSTFVAYVNERDQKLIKAIEAKKPTREQTALLNELSASLMGSLLELAYEMKMSGQLESSEGDKESEYQPGTVGEVLAGLLNQTELELPAVQGDLTRLSERRTRIQGAVRTLGIGREL